MPRRTCGPLDKMIGANIRALRMRAGLSQAALGERIGVTFQQMQKYERGANRIAASQLFRVSQVLDVPIEYFFSHSAELCEAPGVLPAISAADAVKQEQEARTRLASPCGMQNLS